MNDTEHMRDAVFFEGTEIRHRMSRFWILITLASVIAAAGVAADSTATVIGAMIVAPLMTSILGIMLSVVLADRPNLIRSLLLVVGGGLVAIAIGWLSGLVVVNEVVAETNSQVASRVHPRLVDLIAALATGAVGSVALARRDISDTLPGVAIAISLVPPLSVVGFTLEAGKPDQALGASLLFMTNVAAILGSGTIVMAFYGPRSNRHLQLAGQHALELRRREPARVGRDDLRISSLVKTLTRIPRQGVCGWTLGGWPVGRAR